MFTIVEKIKNLSWTQKTIIASISVFILALFVFIPLSFKQSTRESLFSTPPVTFSEEKTWEVTFLYKTMTQKLSIKKITLLDRVIRPDYRGGEYSPYEISLLDSNNVPLFSQKLFITENIVYQIAGDTSPLPTPPSELTTTLYIPYIEGATRLQVTKNSVPLLVAELKNTSLGPFIPKAYAQIENRQCGPAEIVFISDNYTDMASFRASAQSLQQVFSTVSPFSQFSGIFQYAFLENTQPLGCSSSGIVRCITQNAEIIRSVGRSQFPNAHKFIVLVNNPNAVVVDNFILGAALIGGDLSVFTNRSDITPAEYNQVAIHEFLGHSVGILYDRYVYSPGVNIPLSVKSNCTDSSSGEAFWRSAGTTGVYPGCTQDQYFAPGPRTCANPVDGTPTSIMSKVRCGGPNFDAVETHWLRTSIIPQYTSACPSTTPTTTPPTPTPSNENSIGGVVVKDIDGDGDCNDDGDVGLEGAEVSLSPGNIPPVIIDSAGRVSFSNLPPGTYRMTIRLGGRILELFPGWPFPGGLTVPTSLSPSLSIYVCYSDILLTPPPPTPTRPPTSTPTSRVTGHPPPDPVVFYNCYEVAESRTVKGKKVQITRLQCDPI